MFFSKRQLKRGKKEMFVLSYFTPVNLFWVLQIIKQQTTKQQQQHKNMISAVGVDCPVIDLFQFPYHHQTPLPPSPLRVVTFGRHVRSTCFLKTLAPLLFDTLERIPIALTNEGLQSRSSFNRRHLTHPIKRILLQKTLAFSQ